MNTPRICPACGQDLPVAAVNFDADSGVVTANGQSVNLTVNEADYYSCLAASWPRVVTREFLLDWVYDKDADGKHGKLPDVFIGRIRKKLKPLGVKIETAWGRGYHLIYPAVEKP